LILNPVNVATPATAFEVTVPESVPLPGFVPMASVIAFVAVVTMLPPASSMVTVTAGVIEATAAVLVGCAVNTSFVAEPAVTLNALLVAPVSPVLVAANV
jgi:hypothetical protein